jgi:starch-binding outer membrane protein, SusD/RagB family
MKNILTYSALVILVVLSACSKSWLDVQPKGTTLEANYYLNADEAFAGLAAAYDPLGMEWVNTYTSKVGLLNCASDDCYAGGGAYADQPTWEAWNSYTLDPGNGPQESFWGRNYSGINRANTILSKLDGVPMDETLKERFRAEAKFLRGYYYFDLVRLFRNIPMIIGPLSPSEYFNVPQAPPEDVFAQIEKDLSEAIPYLPLTVPDNEKGRVTQYAAIALLGKVILWQNDESRMLEAAALFEQVNTAPYYELLPDYASIFRPDNKFNKESIFEISYSGNIIGYWQFPNPPAGEGNLLVQMCGPRSFNGPVYSAGWGFNPILPDLVTELRNSNRYLGTVANIDSLANAGLASYEKGYQNTGYFLQKFAPLAEFKSTAGGDPVLEWPNDYIEIRLADTYLMEAECLVRGGNPAAAQPYLDAVRARVGLEPVPATLDNIYYERRVELATEGHRWFDLIRTGKAAEVLAFKGFVAGKNEVLPIPLSDIGNTQLHQNPGY